MPFLGGWAVIMCPCGVVYSVKFNIRAESPRDYMDLLLSWKHMPNIVVYDFARGLATHGNLREPEKLPFRPHVGRLKEPTEDNIRLSKEKKMSINLPWLLERKREPDLDGHPITGSAEHYALYDKLHESNAKDEKDLLRRINLVPELVGHLNSQVAEQFFAKMERNNYFLNMMSPTTQICVIRSIIHHSNERINQQRIDKIKKGLGQDMSYDRHGRATIGTF